MSVRFVTGSKLDWMITLMVLVFHFLPLKISISKLHVNTDSHVASINTAIRELYGYNITTFHWHSRRIFFFLITKQNLHYLHIVIFFLSLCFFRGRLHGYTGMTFIPERVHSIPIYFSVSVYMIPRRNFVPTQDILEWVHSGFQSEWNFRSGIIFHSGIM